MPNFHTFKTINMTNKMFYGVHKPTFYATNLLIWVLFLTALPRQEVATGEAIYLKKCARCHGADGTKGRSGAANLQLSKMENGMISQIIQNGKKPMPAYKSKLTEDEINDLITYVKSLRK